MKTTTHQHLADLWLMPQAELDSYLEIAGQIRDLRGRLDSPAKPPVAITAPASAAPPSQHSPHPLGLVRRSPLRSPKPGTLRALVHDVLRQAAGPVRRAEVIEAVAALRNTKVDDVLRTKVGDTLTNRHDPFIKKLAQGVYAYTQPEVTPCL